MKKFFLLAATFAFTSLSGGETAVPGSMNPDTALKKLLEGNKRYTQDLLEHPNRTSERRESLTASQEPFAVIVGCSDSRVSPEIIFDQGIGDLFVVRVAGNVIGPIELASVEYSVHVLHSSIIMVLGHENCGAVSAVLSGKAQGIEPIADKIESAVKGYSLPSKSPLEGAIKANVRAAAAELRKDPDLAKLIKENKLGIVGGYYNLSTGQVEICCGLND